MMVIDHAVRVCHWQENLTNEEMPPPWMWHLDDELEIWFENVQEKREERFSGRSDDEAPELMKNEFAKGRR